MNQTTTELASSNLDLIRGMQAAAFAGDWQGFQTFFTSQSRYRVGNVVDLIGAANIARYLGELFATTFQFTNMSPRYTYQPGDTVIVEYDMEGIRLADRAQVRYPCVDVYGFSEGKFLDWRVYPIEPQFITPQPRVTVEPAREGPASAAKLPQVIQTFQQALGRGDWDLAETCLTTDVVLRVANHPEAIGPAAFVQQLGDVFSSRLRPIAADFTNVWQFPDSLVVELTVNAVRVQESQPVLYRCAETYRFANDQIREYRIYPLEASLLANDGD